MTTTTATFFILLFYGRFYLLLVGYFFIKKIKKKVYKKRMNPELYDEFKKYPSTLVTLKWSNKKLPEFESPDAYASYFYQHKPLIKKFKWPGYFYNFAGFIASQKKLPITKTNKATYDRSVKTIYAIMNILKEEDLELNDSTEKMLKQSIKNIPNPNLILFNILRLMSDTKTNPSDVNNMLINFYKKYNIPAPITGGDAEYEYDIPSMSPVNIGFINDKKQLGGMAEYDTLHEKYPSIGHLRGELNLIGDKCMAEKLPDLLGLLNKVESQFGKISNQIISETNAILFWMVSNVSQQLILVDVRPYNQDNEKDIKTLFKHFPTPIVVKSMFNFDRYNSNSLIQTFLPLNNQYMSLGLLDQKSFTIFQDGCRTSKRSMVYKVHSHSDIDGMYRPFVILNNKYFMMGIDKRTSLLNTTLIDTCLVRGIYLKRVFSSLSKHIEWDMKNMEDLEDLQILYAPLKQLVKVLKIENMKIVDDEDVHKIYEHLYEIITNITNDLYFYLPDDKKIDKAVCLNENFIKRIQRAQQLSQFFYFHLYILTILINKQMYRQSNTEESKK